MKYIFCLIILALFLILNSCEKFLDAKPNQQLVVPTSVDELQALLDNYYNVNEQDPDADERSADNYYLTYADWSSTSDEYQRRVYTWEKDYLFASTGNTEWSLSYNNVYRANVVLDGLKKITRTASNSNDWDNVKGHALFIRAKNFLQIAFIWPPAYDKSSSSTDLCIPLRLDPDFNKVSVRSNVEDTYNQIIADLKEAIPLLPVKALQLLRPCRPAAYALLARTYLSMRQYDNALLYADSSLELKDDLLDYNTLDSSSAWPFAPRFSNPEILIDMYTSAPGTLIYNKAKIDSTLYKSYTANDLRKSIFFRANGDGTYGFRGSYIGAGNIFSGIATDEVYFIKAECLAREGQIEEAVNTLNTVLKSRWKKGTFIPENIADQSTVLNRILTERRKELLMRGLRWADLKRLNKEGANITVYRSLNNQLYTLYPNDLRYALPIPEDVIELTGMPQNPR